MKELQETIDKFSAQLIEAKETFENEQATKEEKKLILDACSAIVRKFAGLRKENRFYFEVIWDHAHQGKQFGFSYLSHYISELFIELARKRYEPVDKKNMSAVMTMAHEYKRNGKELSAAMTKAYNVIERTGKLRKEDMISECNDISATCIEGNWNNIMPNYPSLNKGLNGENNNARPKAKAVILIADMLNVYCSMVYNDK